jgi:hypothetical protein
MAHSEIANLRLRSADLELISKESIRIRSIVVSLDPKFEIRNPNLSNYFVGSGQDIRRYREDNLLGCFQIDDRRIFRIETGVEVKETREGVAILLLAESNLMHPQRGGAATKSGKSGIHRGGAEYAEIYHFQTPSSALSSASEVTEFPDPFALCQSTLTE